MTSDTATADIDLNRVSIGEYSPVDEYNDAFLAEQSDVIEAKEELQKQAQISKQTVIGMAIVAMGTALFCTMGAIVQYHGGSVLQLILGRYIVQNFLAWVIWLCKRPVECHSWYGDPPHRANIWVRGVTFWLTTFCWWRGLELVPLGDGEAILFLSPIMTVIAARLYLKETLPKSFVFTLLLTVAGLMFICQPEFVFNFSANYKVMSLKGLLFLIGADVAWSVSCILVRTAKTAHWLQLETVSTTQAVFLWTPLIILVNQMWAKSGALGGGEWDFEPMTFLMVGVLGVLGFTALMLNVIGYQIGDATKVAWMEYLDLVFAFLYQWLAFGQAPNLWEWIGVACLIGTCAIHLGEEYWTYKQCMKEIDAAEHRLLTELQTRTTDDVPPLTTAFTEPCDAEQEPLLFKSGNDAETADEWSIVDMAQLKNLVQRLRMFPERSDN